MAMHITPCDDNGNPYTASNPMSVVLDGDQTVALNGDVVLDTFGALDDAKVTDPDAASATIPELLRGILKALNDQTVLLQTIADNTEPA